MLSQYHQQVRDPRSCLANNVGRINTTDDGAHISSAVIVSQIIAANESPNESPNKRQRVDYGVLYWPESPEAYQLFKPSSSGSLLRIINETPQEAVERASSYCNQFMKVKIVGGML